MITRRFVFGALLSLSLLQLTALADNATAPSASIDDGLNLRFANGIAAIVESKPITVDDIRREIAPLIPALQRECRNEQEFNQKLEALQDDVIQSLIDRELIVKEFYRKKDGEDEVRHIPVSYIDNRLAEVQADDFGGDRSKFLAYLRSRGLEIASRARRGEKFEELAKQYSKENRRARGGDWGWQKHPDLKKEFSEPLFVLKPGEVTDPILLGDNCFVLFAEDRKYAGTQKIDEVRDEIERLLLQQMSRQSHDRWLERLRRNGYVKHY